MNPAFRVGCSPLRDFCLPVFQKPKGQMPVPRPVERPQLAIIGVGATNHQDGPEVEAKLRRPGGSINRHRLKNLTIQKGNLPLDSRGRPVTGYGARLVAQLEAPAPGHDGEAPPSLHRDQSMTEKPAHAWCPRAGGRPRVPDFKTWRPEVEPQPCVAVPSDAPAGPS